MAVRDEARWPDETPEEVPQISVDLTGEIVAVNEAATAAFPSLVRRGLDHPLLRQAPSWLRQLKEDGQVCKPVYAGGQPYHVDMSYDPGTGLFTFHIREA